MNNDELFDRIEEQCEIAMQASRNRATALFCRLTEEMAEEMGVSTTAFHTIVAEDYGRPFLQTGDWVRR